MEQLLRRQHKNITPQLIPANMGITSHSRKLTKFLAYSSLLIKVLVHKKAESYKQCFFRRRYYNCLCVFCSYHECVHCNTKTAWPKIWEKKIKRKSFFFSLVIPGSGWTCTRLRFCKNRGTNITVPYGSGWDSIYICRWNRFSSLRKMFFLNGISIAFTQ